MAAITSIKSHSNQLDHKFDLWFREFISSSQ